MNFTMLIIGWTGLAFLVLMIAVYRNLVARQEDTLIHLQGNNATQLVEHQSAIARKVQLLDRVGQLSTIAVALLGLGIAVAFFYDGWING
jgi:hypothetical protein